MKTSNRISRLVLVILWVAALLGMSGQAFNMRAEASPLSGAAAPQSPQSVGLTYQWHTFYGVDGSLGESRSVALDADGNVYIAGYSDKTWGSPLHAYSGDTDILVIKLNSLGEYQWHTFYGAAPTSGADGDDEGVGIALDANNNVYVTGYSDRTWQGPDNEEPLNAHGGDAEYMFVLKLNSAGEYQWHTFYQPGRAKAIAVDSSGVYITGYAGATWGSPKHEFSGNLVVLKLNSSGAYQWHTYYGAMASAADETGYGLASDPVRGMVYLTGTAPNTWLGDGNAQPLHPFSGGPGFSDDIVVLKLDSAGNYQWHTFYGADSYDDVGSGIAVDGDGSPYITGYSFDTWGSPLHAHAGERDIAVLKLNAAGAYQWHTFYGSNANDYGYGIAVDGDGHVYISGESADTWQGDQNASPQHAHSLGVSDITVLELNKDGAYLRHTFYGAAGAADYGLSIAVDDLQNVYTTGLSVNNWLAYQGVAPLHPHSGNAEGDSFILKLSDQIKNLYIPFVIRE